MGGETAKWRSVASLNKLRYSLTAIDIEAQNIQYCDRRRSKKNPFVRDDKLPFLHFPTSMALFDQRKKKILEHLVSDEPDLSPKGSPDEQILDLLELINSHEDYVTTSSCSGRVAVFVDGDKTIKEEKGRWLMTSHSPIDDIVFRDSTELSHIYKVLFGDYSIRFAVRSEKSRLVTLKFEPLVCSLSESLLT